jgi:hypothetical protein
MKTRYCGLDRADTVFLAAFTVPGKTYFLVQLGRIQRIRMASTDPLKTAEDQKRSLPLLKNLVVFLDFSNYWKIVSDCHLRPKRMKLLTVLTKSLNIKIVFFFEKFEISCCIYTQFTSAADFGGIIKASK